MKEFLNIYKANDMALVYILDRDTGIAGFTVIPWEMREKYTLDGMWNVESLIQVKCVGDYGAAGFSGGHTMRNSGTCQRLKYRGQTHVENQDYHRIETVAADDRLAATHVVTYRDGDESITVWTELFNTGAETENIEMVSSFSLCGLFGFSGEERTADFYMHRLRSRWSAEGRLETRSFLDMQLEPSWQRYGAQSIRYGQVGSMPVRGFFPWFVLEDRRNGCMIGGNLAIPSSWQIEVFCEDERPAVSGGIADREFGHWMKRLKPGETFKCPKAELTSCIGDLDDISSRITSRQKAYLKDVPAAERELPIVFNEFCTTWGTPSTERIEMLAETLKGLGITYFVIDAGWYADPVRGWESNMGDWIPSEALFPKGLKQASDAIKACGMIPGIWFEPETAGRDASVYQRDDMLLTRDGYPVTTARRRFLDMRKAAVRDYLKNRIIGCLKDNGFGYIKVDYNDTIGIGCDGDESLGENLRVHMACSEEFYQEIKTEVPGIVMENCSSGGHRLEPSLMSVFAMASFSDAHECTAAPVIAANLHRAVLPSQSQIWAVLRKEADEKRLRYVLCCTFLGRMCLSGDVETLSDDQWRIVEESIEYYKRCAPVIRDGKSYRYGPEVRSYGHPEGYQIMVRRTEREAVIVLHTFEKAGDICGQIPALKGFQLESVFGSLKAGVSLETDGTLKVSGIEAFDGMVMTAGR